MQSTLIHDVVYDGIKLSKPRITLVKFIHYVHSPDQKEVQEHT